MAAVYEVQKRKQRNAQRATIAATRQDQSCRYHLKNKRITARDREVLDAMFQSYFDMGGNGVVKHLKAEIDALPTVIEDIH